MPGAQWQCDFREWDKNLSNLLLKLVMFPVFHFSFPTQRPQGFWIGIDDQPLTPTFYPLCGLLPFSLVFSTPSHSICLKYVRGRYLNQSCFGCKKQKLIQISSGRKQSIESLQGHSHKRRVGTWQGLGRCCASQDSLLDLSDQGEPQRLTTFEMKSGYNLKRWTWCERSFPVDGTPCIEARR